MTCATYKFDSVIEAACDHCGGPLTVLQRFDMVVSYATRQAGVRRGADVLWCQTCEPGRFRGQRVEGLPPMPDRSAVGRAEAFARKAHEGQIRKYTGEPYVNHCERVAGLVRAIGGDDNQIAAAWLHDTLEDCDVVPVDLLREFGEDVMTLVMNLSDEFTPEACPDLNRKARKRMEAERIGRMPSRAKLIKLCDMMDNSDLDQLAEDGFRLVWLAERAEVLRQMREPTP